MITHTVMWTTNNDIKGFEIAQKLSAFNAAVSQLPNQIAGTLSARVDISPLPSSNQDFMLVSTHESVEALEYYQAHPAHKAAGSLISGIVSSRSCFDYSDD